MPIFDTPGPVSATVELPIGELRIAASARTDTTVDVRCAPEDRAQADRIRVELAGGELRITGPELGLLQKLTPRTPGRSIEIEIGLPTGSALSVRSGYGGVTAAGRLDACEISSRFGDVQIADAGSATVTAGYGRIRVTGTVDRDAELVADHGGVRVHRVAGAAVLRSKHGPIRADSLGDGARLTGTHGDIEVDVADGDIEARTAYGSARLGSVARGVVVLTGTHGRLEVGIAPTSAAWLDLDTDGRVLNTLTPREDDSGFAESVTVRARSHTGDVVVRRV